jgi:DNA polymerase III delta prime subunit
VSTPPPRAPILGHEDVLAALRRAAAADRLPHAMLFSGPEGVGKRTAALAFARELLAAAVAADGTAGGASSDERAARLAHESLLVYSDADTPIAHRRGDLTGGDISESDLVEALAALEAEGWIRGFQATAEARGPDVIDVLERDAERFLGRRNIPFADVLEKEIASLERGKKTAPKTVQIARRLFSPGISQTLYRRSLGIELVNGRGDGAHFRTIDSMFRSASAGARRIVIFDDAHRMTEEAENALLKTLEEPPPGALIILVTSDPLALLPTTASRCAQVSFRSVPVREIESFLVSTQNLPAAIARMLSSLADGSPGRALRLRGLEIDARRNALDEMLPAIAAGDLARVLALSGRRFAAAAESKDAPLEPVRLEARLFLEMLTLALRDLVVAPIAENAAMASGLERARAVELAQRRAPEEWEWLFRRAELAAEDIEWNVEPRLAVEAMFAEALPAAERRA